MVGGKPPGRIVAPTILCGGNSGGAMVLYEGVFAWIGASSRYYNVAGTRRFSASTVSGRNRHTSTAMSSAVAAAITALLA